MHDDDTCPFAEQLERAQVKIDNLEFALQSNRQIGIAIGILMARHKLTSDVAFDLLVVASQRAHRKIRDLAADVIETGALDLEALTPTAMPKGRSLPAESTAHDARGRGHGGGRVRHPR